MEGAVETRVWNVAAWTRARSKQDTQEKKFKQEAGEARSRASGAMSAMGLPGLGFWAARGGVLVLVLVFGRWRWRWR